MKTAPRMSEPKEFSESGDPIYRHEEPKKDFDFVIGDSENIETITRHIERYVGKPKTVFHELISDLVHIDVHMVAPNEARPYYTLITSGMSDRPMTVPEGYEELRFAELVICLPPDWPMSQEDFKKAENYWPIKLIKFLARFPHQYKTWLRFSHTVPNGNPPEVIADTQFCCALLGQPKNFSKDFLELKISPEKTIYFYSVLPIYREELELKLKKGATALWGRFDKLGVSELVDVSRKNTAQKFLGLF